MSDAVGVILVTLVLVMGSMIVGGILYVVVWDVIKRNIRKE